MSETPTHPKVCVVMAVFDGEAFLREQLDSLKRQSLAPVCVVVGDDGSTDTSTEIIVEFFDSWPTCKLILRPGPGKGYAANFLSLMAHLPDGMDYVALCDQDDVWFDNKLERAVRALGDVDDSAPALYGSSSILCDPEMSPLSLSRITTVAPSFKHAVAQNFAGGNTMVLNGSAAELVVSALKFSGHIKVHDWWLYQLITAANGQSIYDPEPSLYYRQHTRNLIGANLGIKAMSKRFREMLRGTYRAWNTQNMSALIEAKDILEPEAVSLARAVLDSRSMPRSKRMNLLRRSGIYRQGLTGRIGLWLSFWLNKF